MKKTLRIIVLLSALFVTTGHTWAALTESDTQNLFVEPATGGTVNLYGNPDCTGDPVTYAAPGATVYIKAAPDIVHGYPTADMIEAEKTIDTGGAQARGSRRTNGITIANQLTVTEGSAPGIFSFTMPDDEAVSVSITVAFPRAPLSYINAAGQTVDTGNETVTILTGSETRLNAGWYVADATLNYSQTITLKGDVTIILKDGAVMNIGTAQSPVSGNGISGNNYSFSIYAQSTGDDKGKLYVNATVDAIYTKNVTISGGQVTASGGSFGILTENNVTISGGQVEANGSTLDIYASDNVTLGWTSLTDFIQANSYYSENGSVSIADGKAFAVYDGEDLTSYLPSGTLNDEQVEAIGGKTLQAVASIPVVAPQNLTITNVTATGATLTWEPGNVETQWQVAYSTDGGSNWSDAETVTTTTYTLTGLTAETSVTVRVRAYYNDNLCSDFATSTFSTLPPVSYIDAEGNPQQRADYTILTGSETNLNAGWYVADRELNYSETIWLSGEVHLILQDNAVMNVGTEGSPISGDGISGFGYSFSIYAQSTGGSKGQLHVNATGGAIYTKNVTISGGQVTASGGNFGIYTSAGNVTISGGQVEANGSTLGIYASSDLTLGWTSLTNFIQASSYYSNNGTVSIAEGKAFAVYNGETIVSYLLSGTLNDEQVEAIGGKTLRPVDNIPVVAPQNLTIINVTTTGATLTWEPGNVETQWQVAYSTDGGSTWSEAETVTETTYTLTGLTAGTSVTVRVRAYYNDNLCSDFATSTFATLSPVSYIDADGSTKQCADYTVLTGSETILAGGWYVADSELNYSQTIMLSGEVHLILQDGAMMNIGTEQTLVNGNGIQGNGNAISIYAQSTDDSKGQLIINARISAIFTKDVTINGGQVTANGIADGIVASGNVTINGGQVTACGDDGIDASGNVTINGGQVTIDSNWGIYISGNITLGWTSLTDFIQANSYYSENGYVSIAEGKVFKVFDGETLTSYLSSGTLNDDQVEALGGKTLRPSYSPRNLTVSDITTTSATLTWEAGHGETQWTVSHSIDNGASWTEPATVTTTPTYSLTGLTADATVVVKVQPIKANGEADGEPATVSFTTLMCEPENQCAISYDLVDSYGDGWNGASIAVVRVADGKEVASLTVPGGSSTLSGELPLCPGEYNFIWNCGNYDSECSFTLTGPDRYLIADHSRAPSAGQFAQYTLDCDAPKIPQNLTVSNLNETGATLTWEPGDLETQWQVAYSTDGGTTWSNAETVTEPTYTLTGLTTGISVTVRVRAYYDDSLYSKYVTCTFTPNSPVSYLDAEGNTQQRADYIILTGSETTLAAGWYVADGTLNYSQAIVLNGDVHLILKDGAVMNVGTEQTPISGEGIYGNGIYGHGHSLSIYAQSTGSDKGQLNVDATNYAIYVSPGDINICGGKVTVKGNNNGIAKGTGTLNIVAGEVTATGGSTGIHAGGGSVNISGGKVTANGSSNGIYSSIDITISGGEVTATGNNGIEGGGSTLNISGGKVTAIGNYNGIYISGDDITISGGQVEARGSNYGIYDSGNDITISAGKVTANGNTDGIRVNDDDITISGGQVEANGNNYGLFANNGSVNISGGQVEANGGSYGIYSSGGYTDLGWTNPTDFIHANRYRVDYITSDIILNNTFFDEDGNTYSGTIAYENGAYAIDGKTLRPYNGPLNLTVSDITTTSATLTWAAGGTETQWQVSWSTDNGSTWSTPVVVNNCQYELSGLSGGTIVRVRVQAVLGEGVYSAPATCIFGTPLNYLDISGTTQTCSTYTVLTGSETTLAAGWYVADGTLNYSQQITLNGDVHIILKDGAVMNVGTEQTPINGNGIDGNGHSLSIYAQSTGGDKGRLNVDATNIAIYGNGGSVNIIGGKVTANGDTDGIFSSEGIIISGGEVTITGEFGIEGGGSPVNISGGQVEANGSIYGIYTSNGNITISGGQVEANGGSYGIYSYGGYTYLSWTNPTDFIHVNRYCVSYYSTDITLNDTFFDEDGNTYSGTITKVNDAYAIDGKTLMGVDVLEDAAANDIAALGGKHTNIMLNGRTLWKDGAWNTLCLPFSMTAEQVTAQLAPAGLMTLSTSSFADGTLSLNFEDATTIEAGRPYIIRWSKPDDYTADGGFDITNPVFQGVTVPSSYSSAEAITEALAEASRQTTYVDFIGTFSPTVIYESDAEKHNLYLGSDNKLYYPTVTDYQVKSCRGYFQLKNGLTAGEHAGNGVRSFVLNFGDEATGVTTPLSPARGAGGEAWYSIDGVRLDAQPTRKGLYIHGGRKVVIP